MRKKLSITYGHPVIIKRREHHSSYSRRSNGPHHVLWFAHCEKEDPKDIKQLNCRSPDEKDYFDHVGRI